MSEEVRQIGACRCGMPVTRILHSIRRTLRVDGTRFIYTDRPDIGACIIRCESCGRPIEQTWISTSREACHG